MVAIAISFVSLLVVSCSSAPVHPVKSTALALFLLASSTAPSEGFVPRLPLSRQSLVPIETALEAKKDDTDAQDIELLKRLEGLGLTALLSLACAPFVAAFSHSVSFIILISSPVI
jgi:hypothetical protein